MKAERRNLESNKITMTRLGQVWEGPTFSCIAWWMHGKKEENWGFLPVSFRNNTSYSLQLSFIWSIPAQSWMKVESKHKHYPPPGLQSPDHEQCTGTNHRWPRARGRAPTLVTFESSRGEYCVYYRPKHLYSFGQIRLLLLYTFLKTHLSSNCTNIHCGISAFCDFLWNFLWARKKCSPLKARSGWVWVGATTKPAITGWRRGELSAVSVIRCGAPDTNMIIILWFSQKVEAPPRSFWSRLLLSWLYD